MSCECFQIGGPFIGVDPDCEIHCKGGYEDRIAKLETENKQFKEYLLEVKQAASRCEDENERLREENAMLLAAADADAFNLNTLQRCCCQRGARMQKMYAAIQDCTYPDNMEKEFSAWFDEDGVPIDIDTAREGE